MDIKKLENENEEQFLWRLGQAKESGQLDLSWDEIANILNRELGNEDRPLSEAAYRRPYQHAKKFYESGVFNNLSEDEYIKTLQEQKDIIYKEKRKLYDQRREYNKVLTSEARSEHLFDELISVAKELKNIKPLTFDNSVFENNNHKEAIMFWSDWHYGMITDNIWNKYNTTICRERIQRFIDKSKEYILLNGISNLHVVMLGDSAHGAIHSTCRVQSEENTCQQLMHVSELMAEALTELSNYVNHIYFYSCYGNHMRTIQNKNDSIHSDNMECIVPWWIRERLKDNNKIQIVDSEYKEFTKLNVLGYNIVCCHGDLENFRNLGVTVNTIFSRKFGETIDYTVSGDKHHLEEFEQFDIESILIRSLCGTDDYASNKRLYSKSGQTLIIFNDEYGREATYHIPLDN